MNNTHTPGPWKASNYHALGGYPVRTAEPDTTPIAIVPDLTDARLIAEAPAMLAALRTVSGKIGSYHDAETASSRAHIISDIEASVGAILARIDGEAAQ